MRVREQRRGKTSDRVDRRKSCKRVREKRREKTSDRVDRRKNCKRERERERESKEEKGPLTSFTFKDKQTTSG